VTRTRRRFSRFLDGPPSSSQFAEKSWLSRLAAHPRIRNWPSESRRREQLWVVGRRNKRGGNYKRDQRISGTPPALVTIAVRDE